MANSDPFSLSAMLDVLPPLRIPTVRETDEKETPATPPPQCGISIAVPAHGLYQPMETNTPKQNHPLTQYSSYSCGCDVSNPQELDELTLQALFNLMTSSQHDAVVLFEEFFSSFNRRQLHKMASLLTSDLNYFMAIAKHEYGSKRLQKLLGKSDDADALFCDAILFCFLHVMTDKHACFVAVRAMRVFNHTMKETMYKYTLYYTLRIAPCQYGCIALNEIITDLDHPYYRNKLLDIVADNALFLSNEAYGNFVIQHVLRLNDSRCSYNIADKLRGHCVDLSFKKHGSYIVERLLEAAFESIVVVVVDLLECKGDRLMRLARSEYGNYVVAKALRVTYKMKMAVLFRGLVEKLMPFLHLLRRSRRRNIADILDSIL